LQSIDELLEFYENLELRDFICPLTASLEIDLNIYMLCSKVCRPIHCIAYVDYVSVDTFYFTITCTVAKSGASPYRIMWGGAHMVSVGAEKG